LGKVQTERSIDEPQPDPADVPLLTDDYAPVDTLLRGRG
jgi:hypothetical protein